MYAPDHVRMILLNRFMGTGEGFSSLHVPTRPHDSRHPSPFMGRGWGRGGKLRQTTPSPLANFGGLSHFSGKFRPILPPSPANFGIFSPTSGKIRQIRPPPLANIGKPHHPC